MSSSTSSRSNQIGQKRFKNQLQQIKQAPISSRSSTIAGKSNRKIIAKNYLQIIIQLNLFSNKPSHSGVFKKSIAMNKWVIFLDSCLSRCNHFKYKSNCSNLNEPNDNEIIKIPNISHTTHPGQTQLLQGQTSPCSFATE